ncbi:MAG: VCBS repeat-containing protein, partial [Fibrobacter sp.]|nr:VCBS repeat-containing protein [Fibrobacter sp.]
MTDFCRRMQDLDLNKRAMENLIKAGGSLYQFADICESQRQIPSFTVVRNPYQWFTQSETVSYLLNQSGAADALDFRMDLNENAYSSGTHADSGGAWLRLCDLAGAGSYFDTLPAENLRLSPCAYDYDGDGDQDLFCGSSDGCVYYFENLGFTGLDGRLRFGGKQVVVTAPEGVTFSAPAVMDVNADGRADLVVGTADGALRWYRGGAGLYFAGHGTLLDTGYAAQALPAAADFDRDGVTDLIVGASNGRLTLYRGGQGTLWKPEETVSLETAAPFAIDEYGWAAPSAADVNADGLPDLILGSFEGYTDVYPGDGAGGFGAPQRVTMDEKNYKGSDISLRLLPTKDGKGRVPAAEILVNTGAIKEYIQDKDKIDMVEQAVAEGHIQYRSQTFDQALLELYQNEQISLETAMNAATNRDDFDLKVRGITGTSDRGWM